MLLLRLSIDAVLIAIAWQDFKCRLVSIALFPVLVLLLLAEKKWGHEQGLWSTDFLMNLSFLVVQLLILTAYFSLRNGRLIWVAADLLGWGDLLLLAACAFYFSLLNYIFFYLVSLFFALFGWILYRYSFKRDAVKVPLAGLQSLAFIIFLTVGWFHGGYLLTSDDWILRLMKWSQ